MVGARPLLIPISAGQRGGAAVDLCRTVAARRADYRDPPFRAVGVGLGPSVSVGPTLLRSEIKSQCVSGTEVRDRESYRSPPSESGRSR
jgi:hypothetical protein